MAIEASTRSDANEKLLFRLPALLAHYRGGTDTSLSRILEETVTVNRLETPGLRKDHYEFTSPVGDARIILAENELPADPGKEPKTVSLVGLWLTPRTQDGCEAEVEIWYTGSYGLPGYFEGTSTQMTLSVNRDGKRTSAMLIVDPANSTPARLCSQRQGMQDAVMKEDCTITLPGEQSDPLGVRAHEDVTLLGIEGLGTDQEFLAFNVMGRNKEGVERPIPLVIPKQVTVC